MIDHISLRVQDFERAVAFYKAALAPIGYQVVMEFSGAAGLGAGGKPDFWIMQSEPPINVTHVAFASQRAHVDAFHAAAIAAGGSDNGAPGLRPEYHQHYYGAFIFDPEGNNVEVVSHADPTASKPSAARAVAARKPAAKKVSPKKGAPKKAAPKAASKKAAPQKAAPKKVRAKSKPKAKAKGPAKSAKAKPTKSSKKRR
jgi:catechol 2,3-dioxygenase-like lactoylglutathione lyase family enzyme